MRWTQPCSLFTLLTIMVTALVACGGAPAGPTMLPASSVPALSPAAAPLATSSAAAPTPSPATQATAQISAALAQDELADATALRLATQAGSLAQSDGDASLIGLL